MILNKNLRWVSLLTSSLVPVQLFLLTHRRFLHHLVSFQPSPVGFSVRIISNYQVTVMQRVNTYTCIHSYDFVCVAREKERSDLLTIPEAFSNASTISNTVVPLPVPRLYTSQPSTTAKSNS